ncbi:MAG TPA: prephenate dehydratase [Acidobacteriota bacterium]|nr:prephenate dehydratase [Acidobacteriota bacterium]
MIPLIAFQGEPGAYSEIAAGRLGRPEGRRRFVDIFEAVTAGQVALGAIPLENSLGGTIHENYDLLLKYPVQIVAETYVPINHCLMGLPQATLEQARQVLSHPQALAQCDVFLASHPEWEIIPAYDTAGSAKMVREAGDPTRLAIASEQAAGHYQLQVLARNIASTTNNITRFGFIQAESNLSPLPVPQSSDLISTSRKTTLAFTLAHKTGSLFQALCVFAFREINLTKIESRPFREQAFNYLFYADFIEPEDPKISARALDHLSEIAPFLKILGSYPCVGTMEF